MVINMEWINTTFNSGFSDEISKWMTKIDSTGKLIQKVKLFTPKINDQKVFESRLSEEDIFVIVKFIEEVNLDSIKKGSSNFVDDFETATISIYDKKENVFIDYVAQPYSLKFYEQQEGRKYDFDLNGFIKLWEAICKVSPFSYTGSGPIGVKDLKKFKEL
jgi:hypothetical protein